MITGKCFAVVFIFFSQINPACKYIISLLLKKCNAGANFVTISVAENDMNNISQKNNKFL